jgi:spermidine/putrescine transport system substrate-binding protein
MAKKLVSVVVLITVAAGALLAGGAQETQEEEKTLVVVNWKDYGSDDQEFVQMFEEKYDCTIVHEYMASEEELLTKLRTVGVGEFDVVLPNSSILPQAIKEELLQPIDPAELENYDALIDTFLGRSEATDGGEMYAVPWVWGSTSIAYNTELVDDEINSVDVFWDEDYRGEVAIRDDYNDAIMLAAMHLGQDPNEPDDLEAIKEALIEQKPYNRTYWKTGDEFSKLFANEQISVGLAWSGQTLSMKNDGLPIGYVVPKEGAIGWLDYWAIVKDAPHKDLALKFIDELISADYQLSWVEKGGPSPVNEEALAGVDQEVRDFIGMSMDDIDKLHFIAYRDNETKTMWNEFWQEVKAR